MAGFNYENIIDHNCFNSVNNNYKNRNAIHMTPNYIIIIYQSIIQIEF